MAEVYDRWHLSRPSKDAKPCGEHTSKTRTLVPSADHGRGKRWLVRYRDASGEQCKESYEKKSAAEARAAEVESDLNRGQFIDRTAGRESLRAVAERWRAAAVHRPRTASNVERALRLHVYPTFGDRPVSSIQRSEIRAWVKDRSQVLAPTSLRTPYNCLAAAVDHAEHVHAPVASR